MTREPTSRIQRAARAADEPLAEIEAMITRLRELRDRQHDEALRGSYRAAIDRLDGLAYRLKEAAARPRGVVGLPAPARSVPSAAPEPPQRALPLGPVPVIVRARKPKRR